MLYGASALAASALTGRESRAATAATTALPQSSPPPIRSTASSSRILSEDQLSYFFLRWAATRRTLLQAFDTYGPVEDRNVVVDRQGHGRAKGYGFVLYPRTRRRREGPRATLEEDQEPRYLQSTGVRRSRRSFQRRAHLRAEGVRSRTTTCRSESSRLWPPIQQQRQLLLGATPQPVLAAMAAVQNQALYSQNPAAYSSLLGHYPLLAAAALNPAAAASASALNPTLTGLVASHYLHLANPSSILPSRPATTSVVKRHPPYAVGHLVRTSLPFTLPLLRHHRDQNDACALLSIRTCSSRCRQTPPLVKLPSSLCGFPGYCTIASR
ncbi:hypothetical protein BHE74_00014794 [Ensete ventricosum]|nr:hypothetical protein BHE74_00014794 [Ensete ventricosum]